MKNKIHLLLALLVFILSCLYLLPFINLYQGGVEGFLLTGAERTLRGEVPYRDFYYFMTPGAFVFLALLFKLFGVHILVARIITLIISALIVTLTYLLAEKLLKNKYLALLPPFMLLVASFPRYFSYSYHWLSSLLVLTAIYLVALGETIQPFPLALDKDLGRKGRWFYYLAGLFSALTFACLQNKGLLLICALTVYLLLFSSKGKKNFIYYTIGTVLGLGMLFLYLFLTGALKNFFYFTFWWPLTSNYIAANKVPYFTYGKQALWYFWELQKVALTNFSFLNLLRFIYYSSTNLFLITIGYGSIAAIPISFIWGWKIKRKEPSSPEGSLLYLYAIASLVSFISYSYRLELGHLMFGASLPLILFLYFIHRGIVATRIFQRNNKISMFPFLAGLFLSLITLLLTINTITNIEYTQLRRFKHSYYAIETPRGRQWTDDLSYAQDYNLLIPYLKARLKPHEPFIVIYNEAIVYFFLDAYNPLNADFYVPPVAHYYSREKQVNHILEIIKQKKVRFILKDRFAEKMLSGEYAINLPNVDIEVFKQEPISRYIEENYQAVLIMNNFTLYQKKDL